MVEETEVFPHAPLVLVTTEVRLSYEPMVPKVFDDFAVALRDRFPHIETRQMLNPEAGSPIPQLFVRSEENTKAITLSARSLTVETTAYEHFGGFRDTVRVALEALKRLVPDVRYTRIGLRYLDEVRVPGVRTTLDWDGWIAPSLLAPATLSPGMTPVGLTGQMLLRTDPTSTMFRWGEVEGISVLVEPFPLRVARSTEESRFFVLDIDSFQESSAGARLDVDELMDVYGELHRPTGDLFLASVTEQAKELFRGNLHV